MSATNDKDEIARLETRLFMLKNKMEGTIDGLKISAAELLTFYKGNKKLSAASKFFADGVLTAAKAMEKAIKEEGT